jgi:hypothetical protein
MSIKKPTIILLATALLLSINLVAAGNSSAPPPCPKGLVPAAVNTAEQVVNSVSNALIGQSSIPTTTCTSSASTVKGHITMMLPILLVVFALV